MGLGSTDTSFGVSYPFCTCIGHLTRLGHFHVPVVSLKNYNKKKKKKKSKTLNKENIHALNNNSAFKN